MTGLFPKSVCHRCYSFNVQFTDVMTGLFYFTYLLIDFSKKVMKKDRVRGSFEVTLWSQKVSSKENPHLFPCIEHKASKLVLDCIWTVYFNLHKNILTRKVEKIL